MLVYHLFIIRTLHSFMPVVRLPPNHACDDESMMNVMQSNNYDIELK